MASQEKLPDIANSLEHLGETTTAAELVRTRGQSKKLRVISERKLMEWIEAMLGQHLAGKADTFSDQEKEALLKKTQDELARRIKREQDADNERERVKRELDQAMSVLSNAQGSQADLDEALAALKAKLVETEQINQDLQQDNYDLHDKLNEKMALLSSTIAEKETLRTTVRNQMIRSNALVEGVLGLDTQCYGARHQDENPVNEEAAEEEQFYHDFDVGAKVIGTLSGDLTRLRSLAQQAEEQQQDPRLGLLEADLKLIEELKQGSLQATDVAQPVSGLVEALEGMRTEAEQLELAVNDALGVSAGATQISAIPDAGGEPAEVLAGSTGATREIAASLARTRTRVAALREMAAQADEARAAIDQELDAERTASAQLIDAVRARADHDHVAVPTALADAQAPASERAAAAAEIVGQLRGGQSAEQLGEQIDVLGRILGDEAPAAPADATDHAALARHLGEQTATLQQLVERLRGEQGRGQSAHAQLQKELAQAAKERDQAQKDLAQAHSQGQKDLTQAQAHATEARQRLGVLERDLVIARNELGSAQQREKQLADQVRAFASAQVGEGVAGDEHQPLARAIHQLDAALAQRESHGAGLAEATRLVVAGLQGEVGKGPTAADLKRLDDERSRLASQVGQAQSRAMSLERELANARGELAAANSRAEAKRRAEREMAGALVGAAAGDHTLADASADLALALENAEGGSDDLGQQVREALTALARRKQDLADESARSAAELAKAHAQIQDSAARSGQLASERDKQAVALGQAEGRVRDLERDLARLRGDGESLRSQLAAAAERSAGAEGEAARHAAQVAQHEGRLRDLEAALAHAQQELAATNARMHTRHETERQIADQLVRAAEGDEQLANATADLALGLDDLSDGATDVRDQQVVETVTLLAQRKKDLGEEVERLKSDGWVLQRELKELREQATSLESERDEMAASGKEIINLLTHQKERTVAELEALRAQQEKTEASLARFEHRTSAAESANRQLAEALSALANAQAGGTGIEDARVDLELALSQLPDEGEDAVTVPEDLSLTLANSGQKLAAALAANHRVAHSAHQEAVREHDRLKAQVEGLRGEIETVQNGMEEQVGTLRSSQAEVRAVRQEMNNQGRDLAQKVQELTSLRGEMASTKAELAVAQQRVEDQDRRYHQASGQLTEARRELERLGQQLHQARGRAEAGEHAQGQLLQSLRSLTNRQDASPALTRALTDADLSDPLSVAAQKLDLAQGAGPDQVVAAGATYVGALRDRIERLAEGLEEARGELGATKTSEGALQGELAGLRAQVVDRDHEVENLSKAIERAKEGQAEVLTQLMDQRRSHDETAASLKSIKEQLRLAQAEIEDYHARDNASSGHFSSDNDRLRGELEKERANQAQLDTQLSDLRERAEAAEARLRSQRDELTRRLEERDHVIQAKDRQLDQLAAQRSDAKSLEAQVQVLGKELAEAHDRIKALEGVHGENAGVTVRSGDLARELKNLQQERDQLRERHRTIEGDLADAVSLSAQLRTQLDEKRKDVEATREKLAKELNDERERTGAMREEFRRLKEEVVGLKARIRRLTDGGGSATGAIHKPKG